MRFWKTPPDRTTHLLARRGQRLRRGAGDRVVEAGGDDARVGPRAEIRARPRGSSGAASRPRHLVARRAPRVRDRLELDRRLALVGHLVAQPAERGDGVEQPAHARRPRRREAGAHELGDLLGASAVRRRQRTVPARLEQPRDRHPPRLLRPRGRRPGSRTGHRCAGALEVAQVADEELAAPDAAVAPVARAVVDRAGRAARSRRARPGTPRGGRGGAGPRRSRRPRGRARSASRGSRDARRGRRPRARPRTAARSARSPPRRPAAPRRT